MSEQSQPHMSIGEVLSLLQDDFPDVTISKIRFLESQGLLDPERTPSGYRKFYEPDVERLRWILLQQKENFLPLKVIKDRLDEVDPADGAPPPDEKAGEATVSDEPDAAPPPAVDLGTGRGDGRFTMDDLASRSGLALDDVQDLCKYGLLHPQTMGREDVFDADDLEVARVASGFVRYGVEARHLRMYKVSAEREAGFLEQVITPMLKQRNPEARQNAVETLGELAGLGEQLRASMLRHALRPYI